MLFSYNGKSAHPTRCTPDEGQTDKPENRFRNLTYVNFFLERGLEQAGGV